MDAVAFRVVQLPCFRGGIGRSKCRNNMRRNAGTQVASALSYQNFIDFAVDESSRRTRLIPSPLQERVSKIQAIDGTTKLNFLSYEASRIRIMRSMYIDGDDSLQVFDFAVLPKFEFDLPIFCANFYSNPATSIIVLDLNPLHDVIVDENYKEKYYRYLMPLGVKYAELLPWGGKLTSESLRFFSPIVIWTRFAPSQQKQDILFEAFKDYYKAWLDLMEEAVKETDDARIMDNMEAQHRYLTWRAEKDPGHRMLKNLIGEAGAKEVLNSFLFSGIGELGSKKFLDYFPEYKLGDGTVNEKRSVMGKSFDKRPWDSTGQFIANSHH
ncbi:hypothetical protein vseg_015038 [Gypsophila vaccaria]